MSNWIGLDPEQNQCSVGPDLGPNCLQRLSTDDCQTKAIASKEIVNYLLKKANKYWQSLTWSSLIRDYFVCTYIPEAQ